MNRREDENLRYIETKLAKAKWSAVFVFLYTLTPLSTTALFIAVAAARVWPWHILPPFFLGRLITDGPQSSYRWCGFFLLSGPLG